MASSKRLRKRPEVAMESCRNANKRLDFGIITFQFPTGTATRGNHLKQLKIRIFLYRRLMSPARPPSISLTSTVTILDGVMGLNIVTYRGYSLINIAHVLF